MHYERQRIKPAQQRDEINKRKFLVVGQFEVLGNE